MKRTLTLILFLVATVGYSQSHFLDSLLQIVAKHPKDTNEIRALDWIGSEYMRTDLTKAKLYCHKEIALAKELHTIFGLPGAYAGLVAMHQQEGNLDSARYYLSLLEQLSKENPRNKKAGVNYYNTAGLFYKQQSRYKEALPYMLDAVQFIDPKKDKTNLAGQFLNIGNLYHSLGELKNAASYHLKALTLFEEVKHRRGQSYVLQSLGEDFIALKQFKVAEKYLLESTKIKEESGDKRGLLNAWMSLGEIYQQMNKPKLSIKYSIKGLTLARELKITIEEARSLFNIAVLLKSMKKYEEAKKTFFETLMLARQMGDSLFVSKIKAEMVVKGDEEKDRSEEEILVENIRISLEKGDRANAADGYNKMAEWYASHDQFEKAFNNLKQAQEHSDSLRGNEIILHFKKLEEEYKSEKREKEIALLKKDQELKTLTLGKQSATITSIVIALIGVVIIGLLVVNRYRVVNKAKRLIEIERVRNNIARDLHDDVGSTLSSINILSQVALVEKNGNTQNYLQRIGDQSARMMEDIGDIVWSINPQNDSMNQVITRMKEFSAEILESRNISYHFSEKVSAALALDADKRKNLFMIFKETINNAAKYSQGNEIEIELLQEDHVLTMRIKDNGQGFEEQNIKSGNGLRNIRDRAREVKGSVSVNSIVGEGTEMELRLPLA